MSRVDELKLVRNALIEALRNGKSEPISIDYKVLGICIKYLAHSEGLCIQKPRYRYLPFSEQAYYFEPDDFISISQTEDHKFVIYSRYKQLVQELKYQLNDILQRVDQEYAKLHPIDGWNSEYDKFME